MNNRLEYKNYRGCKENAESRDRNKNYKKGIN